METLSKLWNGDLAPICALGEESEEVKALLLRNKKELEQTLDNAQKKCWENYLLCAGEQLSLLREEAFCYGFSLGMRLAVEALSK